MVDQYFTLSDTLEEVIEAIEVKLLAKPRTQTFTTIQRLKRELVFIRKAITPLREVLAALQRSESPLIQTKTLPYFRDVFDHAIRVIDTIDSFRDLINGMLDIYLTSISNRMNEIMKVLTVFATIFIPLTFVVGIYGMNFDYMPELHWQWSYPILWMLFFLIPAVLLLGSRKRSGCENDRGQTLRTAPRRCPPWERALAPTGAGKPGRRSPDPARCPQR